MGNKEKTIRELIKIAESFEISGSIDDCMEKLISNCTDRILNIISESEELGDMLKFSLSESFMTKSKEERLAIAYRAFKSINQVNLKYPNYAICVSVLNSVCRTGGLICWTPATLCEKMVLPKNTTQS